MSIRPPAVRVLLIAEVLTAVGVTRPDLLGAAARSPVAWLVGAGVVAASVLTRVLVARVLHRPGLAPWTATAVTLVSITLLIAPSLRETTLVEPFPAEAVAEAAVIPPANTAGPSTRPPRTPRAPTAATTTRLRAGRLHGIDHAASGGVGLYRLGDRLVLRFEGVAVQGTPGPSVHLVPRGHRTPTGGVRLGRLKAEHGSFSYSLPTGIDPARAWSVLIWCDPYRTPIAGGDLR